MRRSSSIAVTKENPRTNNSFSITTNNNHPQDNNDSFCYDKLESVHFESQELQTKMEALITRMKNEASLQNNFRTTDQGFLKIKKEDFVSYYNQLRDIYKGTKKLCGDWDSLFEDFSTKHSQGIAKKNKEVESLAKHYKYKLKALDFEKKSALEAQKSDLLRREQEVLDSVNSFINSLKGTKKFWDNNINELQFCVQEHAQTIEYLFKHKTARMESFSQDLDAMFSDALLGDTTGNTERNREYNQSSKQPLTEMINILSPINPDIPKIGLQMMLDKSKEDSNVLSSKRVRGQGNEVSNNSYEDLFMLNKMDNGPGVMQENSRFSLEKEEGGWDPNLDDDDEEDEEDGGERVDIEKIEKALDMLFQQGLLGSVSILRVLVD